MMRLLAALVLSASAWAQLPHLQPRELLPDESVGRSFWLLSPDIVVAKIEKAEWEGPEIEITPPQKMVVRLVSVRAEVENVVQGDVPRGPIQFYFFANTLSRNGYHTVLEWFEPGGRYIVFLRKDGGVLRAIADVAGLNIQIWSGRHDHIPTPQTEPAVHDPGVDIAYLALSPSTDVETGFAATIQRVYDRLLQVAPPSEILLLLRNLLSHEGTELREQACLTLSRSFRYRDPCLAELLRSADEATRIQAGMLLRMQSSADWLVKALDEDPLSLSISGEVSELSGDLGLFLFDPDPAVRKQACSTLVRLFPSRQFPNCVSAPADK